LSRAVLWSTLAWEDYVDWQSRDKKTLKRINTLVKECQREPFDGIGKPEQLRGDMAGWWSRKIDDKHRVIYQADEKTVTILACRDHYDDH
jgi:toxin YoeB